jgi:hypothetical protein
MKVLISVLAAMAFIIVTSSAPALANRYDGKGRNVAHYGHPKKPPATKKMDKSH